MWEAQESSAVCYRAELVAVKLETCSVKANLLRVLLSSAGVLFQFWGKLIKGVRPILSDCVRVHETHYHYAAPCREIFSEYKLFRTREAGFLRSS